LESPKLIADFAPGSVGEGPEILQGSADPAQRLVSHGAVYK